MERNGIFSISILIGLLCFASVAHSQRHSSYNGLVMAGYQGWFNTPDDGTGRNWRHYGGKQGFKPGSCSVDFWADVSEYKKVYKTDFVHKDGTSAYTFSSYDYSTVDLHFSWMKEYDIDGAFMQRFVSEIKRPLGKDHFDKVLSSAFSVSEKYDRAVCIMYDLSGMQPGDDRILLNDIDSIERKNKIKEGNLASYLYHNGKPLVAVWGAGFDDKRKYGLSDVDKIVNGLRERGYSILIGVPTYWRELKNDAVTDSNLHRVIKKCDIVLPWFVGRYNEKNYLDFAELIDKDIEWCKENKIDYAPVCYPGFSWRNMRGKNSFYVARNSGNFLWKQFYLKIKLGAQMIYVAMFDEIDEGTAIFKCANRSAVPLNEIHFDGIEDNLPTDHYLWITGIAGKMLRKEIPLAEKIPLRVVQGTGYRVQGERQTANDFIAFYPVPCTLYLVPNKLLFSL